MNASRYGTNWSILLRKCTVLFNYTIERMWTEAGIPRTTYEFWLYNGTIPQAINYLKVRRWIIEMAKKNTHIHDAIMQMIEEYEK